jgi:hypothetical protein
MLGDRRGWLLLIAQPVAIAAVVLLAIVFIDGTRWLVVFPPLLALIVVWIGQAVDAYQRALKLGASRGGEMAIVFVLPVALVAITCFWLFGGRHGSASATLQQYIEAWLRNRPAQAAALFATPHTPDEVSQLWADQAQSLAGHIGTAYVSFGADSGLDPDRPFDSLRFRDPVTAGAGRVSMTVELVRNERVESSVLGFIPTAGQQEVVVEREMTFWLEQQPEPAPSWLPLDEFTSSAWKITDVVGSD